MMIIMIVNDVFNNDDDFLLFDNYDDDDNHYYLSPIKYISSQTLLSRATSLTSSCSITIKSHYQYPRLFL